MQLGMVGLGRMGSNLARRAMRAGHECVAFDVSADRVEELSNEGALGARSIEEFVEKLQTPRAAWVMVPAGDITEQTVNQLAEHMQRELLLPRRPPSCPPAVGAGHPPRGLRHQRRSLGP